MKTRSGRVIRFSALLALGLGCSSARAQLSGYTTTNAFPGVSFSAPVCLASPPGETNRLFVLEKSGPIAVITNLAAPTYTLFMDLTDRVNPSGEGGLLGLAFHPGYESNRLFFVYYTGSATNETSGFHDILARFQTSASNPNQGDASSELRLIAQYDEADNHDAGDIHFGPDNYLYVSLGDEGAGDDALNNSQRIDKDFFSGILRLDVDNLPGNLPPNPHPASVGNYSIPSDNPFVGATNFNGSGVNPANVRTEFWAVGLRNPWRWSFDPANGDLYCGDVGQNAWEEIDIITKGGNYGWAYREGDNPGPKTPPGGFTSIPPIRQYVHSYGTGYCVIGGVVYRGNRFPDLVGYYIYADYITGRTWALKYDGTNASPSQQLFVDQDFSAFGTDPANGDVLCADIGEGLIKRIVPPPPPGALHVTLNPPGAVAAGAQWRVDNSAFQDSGVMFLGIAAGTHTVSFKTVAGWTAPNSFTVTIVSDSAVVTNATYLPADTTKPVVTILTPKSGQRVSNDVFTATGTANDYVVEIWFQLNGGAWSPANGTNTWSADNLALSPGDNTIRVYAVDANGRFSNTNSVAFVYVVNVPVVVQIVEPGFGSVKPNFNSVLLQIDKRYTMTAKAAKGFAFVNWTGSLPTNTAKLSFVMASNLTFTANFVDTQDPVAIVLFPAVNKHVTNTMLNAAGKASDNVGVSSVAYLLNGAGLNTATTTNGFTNWLAGGLAPNLGGNVLQTWAIDDAGNVSRTNRVRFIYDVVPSADWAPDSLSGLIARVAPDSGELPRLAFDALTFNQTGTTTNDDFSVGNYVYDKTGTNTAQLTLTNVAPPNQTNHTPDPVALVFTNHYSGTFSNEDDTGAITFVIAINFAPVSVAGKKVTTTGSHGVNTASLKSNGTFTLTPSISGAATSSAGSYTYRRFSPIGAMLVLTFTGTDAGTVAFIQMTFTSSQAGSTFVTVFGGAGEVTDLDIGSFTVK